MGKLKKVLHSIDRISYWSAQAVSAALIVMVAIIAYDVVMRYLFRAPTIWQYDLSYMLGGSIVLLGAGYVHSQHKHVRVDILYNLFPEKARITIDIICTLIFFIPFYIGLIYIAGKHAIHAWNINEFSEVGFWRPRMWPFRSVISIGLIVVLLQGLAMFVRDVYKLMKDKEL